MDLELALTLAQSGLGTAEFTLKRKAAKEKNPAKKKKLQKVAATLRVSNDAITELLSDDAFAAEPAVKGVDMGGDFMRRET